MFVLKTDLGFSIEDHGELHWRSWWRRGKIHGLWNMTIKPRLPWFIWLRSQMLCGHVIFEVSLRPLLF